jgi:hypothetical protein
MTARPKTIQINIPDPCSQDWNQMAPNGQGRFCAQCQKTVIDFTHYTDAQLYEFFTKHTEHVCGRYLANQVNRDIHIPYQPHSKLYKWVIAAGLVLMFTHIPESHAQSRPPRVSVVQAEKEDIPGPSSKNIGTIAGKVVDQNKNPVVGAILQVSDGIWGGAVTDIDGNYLVHSLPVGIYKIKVSYTGFTTTIVENVRVSRKAEAKVNFTLEPNQHRLPEPIVMGGRNPLIEIGRMHNDGNLKRVTVLGGAFTPDLIPLESPGIHMQQKRLFKSPKLYDLNKGDIPKSHKGAEKSTIPDPYHLDKEDIDHMK